MPPTVTRCVSVYELYTKYAQTNTDEHYNSVLTFRLRSSRAASDIFNRTNGHVRPQMYVKEPNPEGRVFQVAEAFVFCPFSFAPRSGSDARLRCLEQLFRGEENSEPVKKVCGCRESLTSVTTSLAISSAPLATFPMAPITPSIVSLALFDITTTVGGLMSES